ncbi:hypothetical protein JKP88DRAFT_296021 [Tribonema minus]|uniref:Phosphatidylinositol N-acetylglucosaminyltransferase subunit H conserved domain-containing protein n=1 Tax=Tribonema minus TaxID=303371 RepID=A0A836CLX6_9STRA|nr:hypothetical protein JKP88DRAFT_296021 [Tribonema minus]
MGECRLCTAISCTCAVCVVTLWALPSPVQEESVTLLRGLGVQVARTRRNGASGDARFIPLDRLSSAIIAEGIVNHAFGFYLAFVVRGATADAAEAHDMVIAFEAARPRLDILKAVHEDAQRLLWPQPLPPSAAGAAGAEADA